MTYDELVEKVARVLCREWGYNWEGDPDDVQTSPEDNLPYDDRPSKRLFRGASIAAIATIREALLEPKTLSAMRGAALVAQGLDHNEGLDYRLLMDEAIKWAIAASPLVEKSE